MEIVKYNAQGIQVVTGVSGGIAIEDILTAEGQIIYHDGVDIVALSPGSNGDILALAVGVPAWTAPSVGGIPSHYKSPYGLNIRKLDSANLYITPGMVEVNGVLVTLAATQKLTMSTAGHWISGASNEAASEFVWIYIDEAGNIKLHNIGPNLSQPADAVFTARINGSPGLNGTSIVYDTDTGEGNVLESYLLLVYSDSLYTTGRGRGTGAADSRNFISAALITAINTGTNTITVEAGHNINLTDNDYLMAVPCGPLIYRNVGGTYWRAIGAMWNNASSNLEAERVDRRSVYTLPANLTTTSTSLTAMDATNMTFYTMSMGEDLMVEFSGVLASSSASGGDRFDFLFDGIQQGGTTGIQSSFPTGNTPTSFGWSKLVQKPLPGMHVIVPQFAVVNASTMTVYGNGASSGAIVKPDFIVYRLKDD